MNDAAFSRLKGRALANKLNQHMMVSLILMGGSVSAAIASVILSCVISKYYIIGFVLFTYGAYSSLVYLKKLDKLSRELKDNLYSTTDKQYVWNVEKCRDKLVARCLQEKICPWKGTPCFNPSDSSCLCSRQAVILSDLGLDVKGTQKILLDATDTAT